MITAELIKDCSKNFSGTARLYKLSESVPYGWLDWEDEEAGIDNRETTEYVIVSAAVVMFTGPETYIFPSNKDGDIVDWGEMDGSYRGDLNHQRAIENAGWELKEV